MCCQHALSSEYLSSYDSISMIQKMSGGRRDGGSEPVSQELAVYPPIHRLGPLGRWIRQKLMSGKSITRLFVQYMYVI